MGDEDSLLVIVRAGGLGRLAWVSWNPGQRGHVGEWLNSVLGYMKQGMRFYLMICGKGFYLMIWIW